MSKVHACSHEITNEPLWVHTTKTLWLQSWKTNYNAEKCASDVKKNGRIAGRKQDFKGEANNMQLESIKKILNEATRIVNVCLISWFFYLFLLCSIRLLVKYDFILRYEAWVNAIRASSFIETFPQISAKPIDFQRNLLGMLPQNQPFFTNRFSAKLTSKIPVKFSWNRPVLTRICPWKSCEILTFFSATYRKPCLRQFLSCKTSSVLNENIRYYNMKN